MSIIRNVEAFVADVCAGKTNETPSTYLSKLKRFIRFTKDAEISTLTLEDVEAFRRSLIEQRTVRRGSRIQEGRLSPFTIHTVMRTVKHFLCWSYSRGLITFDPSPIRIPPPPPPDPKPVTASNVFALLLAAARMGPNWERARNIAILYTLRDTAGRISAILKADIDNLDLSDGRMYVREKGGKMHTLYLNTPTIAAIRNWLEYRPMLAPKDNALFISQRGTALKRSGYYSVLLRLKQAAGIQGRVNPHAFRHAWVRDALSAGADLSKVSQTLAHSNIRVTSDYYARWADHELKESHARYSPGAHLPLIIPPAQEPEYETE